MFLSTPETIKNKVVEFINNNDLDYNIVDNQISKFSISAYDKMVFYIYEHEEKLILVKYDKDKDDINNPASMAYEYFYFNDLNKLLESLMIYDKSITKRYWDFIANDINMGVNKQTYIDNWYEDIINENFKLEDLDEYRFVYYESSEYNPSIKSPYNTIHEVSPLNPTPTYNTINKLYFEIHPICCENKSEKYVLKLLCNNDEVFKEYINYFVQTKKGIKMLIENIFNEMGKFKI